MCATIAVAIAAPAAASGQSAVDEYTLDIPQAGGGAGGGSGTDPTAGAAGGGGTVAGGGAGSAGNGVNAASRGAGNESGESVDFSGLHGGEDVESLAAATGSRSAPEVVADAVFDSAMLPILAALALITGLGAWRIFRGRWTLSGEPG